MADIVPQNKKIFRVSDLIKGLVQFKQKFGNFPVWATSGEATEINHVSPGTTNTGKQVCLLSYDANTTIGWKEDEQTKQTSRTFTDQDVEGLRKFASIVNERPVSATSLGFELIVYIESLIDTLCSNDWYEGDPDGEDSKSYFQHECTIVDAIHLAEKLYGEQLPIHSEYYITGKLKINALMVEEIVKIRDHFPWLDLQYAPDYTSKGEE